MGSFTYQLVNGYSNHRY